MMGMRSTLTSPGRWSQAGSEIRNPHGRQPKRPKGGDAHHEWDGRARPQRSRPAQLGRSGIGERDHWHELHHPAPPLIGAVVAVANQLEDLERGATVSNLVGAKSVPPHQDRGTAGGGPSDGLPPGPPWQAWLSGSGTNQRRVRCRSTRCTRVRIGRVRRPRRGSGKSGPIGGRRD